MLPGTRKAEGCSSAFLFQESPACRPSARNPSLIPSPEILSQNPSPETPSQHPLPKSPSPESLPAASLIGMPHLQRTLCRLLPLLPSPLRPGSAPSPEESALSSLRLPEYFTPMKPYALRTLFLNVTEGSPADIIMRNTNCGMMTVLPALQLGSELYCSTAEMMTVLPALQGVG